MNIKRIFAAGAAALTLSATTALAAPATAADTSPRASIGVIDELIGGATTAALDGMTCQQLHSVLSWADSQTPDNVYDKSFTRSQLQANLTKVTASQLKTSPYVALFTSKYAGKTADKALKCGLVKEDPQLPGALGSLTALSSQAVAMQPVIETLSSRR